MTCWLKINIYIFYHYILIVAKTNTFGRLYDFYQCFLVIIEYNKLIWVYKFTKKSSSLRKVYWMNNYKKVNCSWKIYYFNFPWVISPCIVPVINRVSHIAYFDSFKVNYIGWKYLWQAWFLYMYHGQYRFTN
jgi:hypothetical protein